MSRWRSSLALKVGVAALVAALIVLIPLRVAFGLLGLDRMGVAASGVSGSVWSGRVEQLRVGKLYLGNMRAGLSPLQLLAGRARLDLSRRNGAPDDLAGAISVSRNSVALDDVTGSIGVAGLLAPLPVSALDLDDVSVRFSDGVCEAAEGKVRARLGLILDQTISGSVRCDGRRVLLLFGDPAGPARIELRIAGDGSYTGTMAMGGEAGALLAGLGFTPAANGLRLDLSGSLR